MIRRYRTICAALLLCSLTAGGVWAAPGDLAELTKASDLDPDPADAQAVLAVCTACHSASQFLTAPRPYLRWQQTMQDMLDRGAVASDEQLDRVLNYLVKNITVVNVNSSDPDQMAFTLQIPRSVADKIVERRTAHALAGIDDLKAIPGVNLPVMQKLKAKGLLQF